MKVPVFHQTDIFHHHADPDDHWDLACQFALAYENEIDLKGVLIDYPPSADFFGWDCGDPAIAAILQLSCIAGQAVPIGVGADARITCDADIAAIATQKPLNAGVALLLKVLAESAEPVVLHIVGSCRDVAVASKMHPELFKEKCKAVYLNAGSSCNENELEYNVALDAYSYSTMFDLPCPLYWMPCFHSMKKVSENTFEVGEYGTYYHFEQKSILPYLSQSVQKYFEYVLGRVMDQRWLSYLKQPVNGRILDAHGNLYRNMWCTAGFLHTAGKTVTTNGEIVPLGSEGTAPVFEFVSADITCGADGKTKWSLDEKLTGKFIFKVTDIAAYESAMTQAMKQLLMKLP